MKKPLAAIHGTIPVETEAMLVYLFAQVLDGTNLHKKEAMRTTTNLRITEQGKLDACLASVSEAREARTGPQPGPAEGAVGPSIEDDCDWVAWAAEVA